MLASSASLMTSGENAGMPARNDQPGVPFLTQVVKAASGNVSGARRFAAPPWPTVPWHAGQPIRR